MTAPDVRAAAILDLVQRPDADGYVRASKITWAGKPDRHLDYLLQPVIYVTLQRQERDTN